MSRAPLRIARVAIAMLLLALLGPAVQAQDTAARGLAALARATAESNAAALARLDPNATAAGMRLWRRALARVRSGSGARAVVAFAADSTMSGYGAGTGGPVATTGAEPFSMAELLAAEFNRRGIPASADNWFGSKGIASAAQFAAYDSRLSLGAGWVLSSQNIAGGAALENGADTSMLGFTPRGAWDSCSVYYAAESGYGAFNILIDGAVSGATVNAAGVSALGVATRTVPLGTHMIAVQPTAVGAKVQILGMDCYRTDKPVVDFANTAWGGSATSSWLDTARPYSSARMLQALKPDLLVTDLGLNDRNKAVPVGTYQARIDAILSLALASSTPGSVLLTVPGPADPASWPSPDLEQPYRAALIAEAGTHGLPCVDLFGRFGSYAMASGTFYYDSAHMLGVGYWDVAGALATTMLQ